MIELIKWAESQKCISCKHGEFVMGGENERNNRIGDSSYLCFLNDKFDKKILDCEK